MPSARGKITMLKVFNDWACAIVDGVHFFMLWSYNNYVPGSLERLTNTMWFSMIKDAMINDMPITLSSYPLSTYIREVRLER